MSETQTGPDTGDRQMRDTQTQQRTDWYRDAQKRTEWYRDAQEWYRDAQDCETATRMWLWDRQEIGRRQLDVAGWGLRALGADEARMRIELSGHGSESLDPTAIY